MTDSLEAFGTNAYNRYASSDNTIKDFKLNDIFPKSFGHHKSHSFNQSRSWLYFDIPRPDAPVIYTGEFPILTALPGSEVNIQQIQKAQWATCGPRAVVRS